ncbi:MAG TPA: CBS domain-containing protein [Xanthobacteraceae bacterium]|nr:CBS domain-containing protein [Xanthobacteraceae bacterium]
MPDRDLEAGVNVSDAMTPQVISVGPAAPILDAARLMLENHISGLPVIDAGSLASSAKKDLLRRQEIGTERQQSRWLDAFLGPPEEAAAYVHSHGMKVGEVMTTRVVTVGPEATLDQAVRLMETHEVKRLPVVHQDRVIGIISRADLLRALVGVFSSLSASSQEDAAMRERILQHIGRQCWSAGALVDVVQRNGVAVLWGSISDGTM